MAARTGGVNKQKLSFELHFDVITFHGINMLEKSHVLELSENADAEKRSAIASEL
jgi:hypothetical protein